MHAQTKSRALALHREHQSINPRMHPHLTARQRKEHKGHWTAALTIEYLRRWLSSLSTAPLIRTVLPYTTLHCTALHKFTIILTSAFGGTRRRHMSTATPPSPAPALHCHRTAQSHHIAHHVHPFHKTLHSTSTVPSGAPDQRTSASSEH